MGWGSTQPGKHPMKQLGATNRDMISPGWGSYTEVAIGPSEAGQQSTRSNWRDGFGTSFRVWRLNMLLTKTKLPLVQSSMDWTL